MVRRGALLAAVCGAVVLLEVLAPLASVRAGIATAADPGADPTTLVTSVVAAAAWSLAGWIATSVVLVLLAGLPGAAGRVAACTAGVVTPAVVRRALGAGAAASMALAPALCATAAGAAPAALLCVPGSGALPSLDRAPGPDDPCAASASPSTPQPLPSASVLEGPAAAALSPSLSSPPRTAPDATAVTVRTGDTLWALAEAELARDRLPTTAAAVAIRWPAWWQANRSEIGSDPDLLHPGTLLSPPATPTAPSAPEESP